MGCNSYRLNDTKIALVSKVDLTEENLDNFGPSQTRPLKEDMHFQVAKNISIHPKGVDMSSRRYSGDKFQF